MKRCCLLIFLTLLLTPWITPPLNAADLTDTDTHPKCPFCDMDREQFAFSRVLVSYDNASSSGYCSLHCAAISIAINVDKAPVTIQVADYNTRELIDAESAAWVIGGDRPGVMTQRAKWAFKDRSHAEAFVKKHGGAVTLFDAAMKAVFEDMYADTRTIREKRKQQDAQARHEAELPPNPSPEEKCPVCGMFVAKYPDWVGVVTFADGRRQYFDGAKDLFKFLFDIQKYIPRDASAEIRHIHVTDYYDMKFIDARSAFYVIGSDVYGPMGREMIPLASRPDAETFLKDHNGMKILQFNDITPDTVRRLD